MDLNDTAQKVDGPTMHLSLNIKHVKIIRATLKTYKTYANKIHYQIDHDFRRVTKLVWHFCDFSTFYFQFLKSTELTKQKSKPKRKGPMRLGSARRRMRGLLARHGPAAR